MVAYYDSALKWWSGTQWLPEHDEPAISWYEAPTSISTTTSLSVSASTINRGQSVTLTATVSGTPAGSVQFLAGSTVIATDTASPWTATHAPTATTSYTAKYLGSGAYLGSTSTAKSVTVKQLTSITWTGYATWSQGYEGDNTQRTDTTDCHYGYYSSSRGNHRSLYGFAVPAALTTCYDITKVRIKFYNIHAYQNSGGHINIGTHNLSSKPATWPDANVDQNLYDFGSAPKPGWVDLTLTSQMAAKFKAGHKGYALGPGPSNSTLYYGYAAGATNANKPYLEIVYREYR